MEALRKAHPKFNSADAEKCLAVKLHNKSLDKPLVASYFAQKLNESEVEAIEILSEDTATYLIEAIKYACV